MGYDGGGGEHSMSSMSNSAGLRKDAGEGAVDLQSVLLIRSGHRTIREKKVR